ncbi:unnamed protein product [Calypogeia fissa]
MASSAVSVNQSRSIYRGVSEGTGLAAADLARVTLNEEAELMQACECCGLAEECTRSYVARVRSVFCGRYICGLCTEAVKEERGRNRSATMEEALNAHMAVCAQFNRAARADPLVQLANVAELMRQILRKSAEGGSAPNSPKRPASFRSSGWRNTASSNGIIRSTSCTSILQKPPSLEIS